MGTKEIVIRELRPEESRDIGKMVLSGLFEDFMTFRNTLKLMFKPLGCVWLAILLVFVHKVTESVVLSVLLPPLGALLSSFVFVYLQHQQHLSECRQELGDLHGWYAGRPGSRFWIAVNQEGKAVGTIAVDRTSEETAELKRMRVLPSWRGKGVGKLLMKQLVEHCRKTGIEEVFLDTSELAKAVACQEGTPGTAAGTDGGTHLRFLDGTGEVELAGGAAGGANKAEL
ncbi:hypothetical protein Bbelb_031350 [Branchiostoma belcheri]|nr:hypothetical protein Bbelb_031350 [Branchiostoma belcheri]